MDTKYGPLWFALCLFYLLISAVQKNVLFLIKFGLTKSHKGLIFVSEKAWAPCVHRNIHKRLSDTLPTKFTFPAVSLSDLPGGVDAGV